MWAWPWPGRRPGVRSAAAHSDLLSFHQVELQASPKLESLPKIPEQISKMDQWEEEAQQKGFCVGGSGAHHGPQQLEKSLWVGGQEQAQAERGKAGASSSVRPLDGELVLSRQRGARR